mgnify:CR=1 FL=1
MTCRAEGNVRPLLPWLRLTRRQFLALFTPLLLVFAGFIAIFVVERNGPPGLPPWDDDFTRSVRERMAEEYVHGTSDERLGWEAYFHALNAYVRTFDGYAAVVPPWDVAASRERSSGQYHGIGIRIERRRERGPLERVKIVGVKPGGPADQAGVRIGDAIVGVGNRTVRELCPRGDDTPLQEKIRGPEGTSVRLQLEDPAGSVRPVDVLRAEIDVGSVFGARILDPARGVGYIRVGGFKPNTPKEFREKADRLLEEGMRALVLDLRGNEGGYLDQALELADLFLPKGVIMRQRGRLGSYTGTYTAKAEGTWSATLPLAVLLDRGSASASEIFAGALQDHRRAVLVGERSYGKFLVQVVEAMETRYGPALFKRTTSVYETPLGNHYQRAAGSDGRPNPDDPLAGIPPDVLVPLTQEEVASLYENLSHDEMADWSPGAPAPHPGFADPHVAAARAVLAGEPCTPRLPPPPEQ